jgi:hypothetical protein
VLHGWRGSTLDVEQLLSFHHFDLYAQALAKIERGHATDRSDVEELINRGLVHPDQLAEYFDTVAPNLYRCPAIAATSFGRAVADVVADARRRRP